MLEFQAEISTQDYFRLFLGDLNAHFLLHYKACNSFISFWRIHISKHQKHICFLGIGNPHFTAIEYVIISWFFCACLQCERIASRACLWQTKTAHLEISIQIYSFSCKLGQVLFLQLQRAILAEYSVDKCILHITDNTDWWVDLSKL